MSDYPHVPATFINAIAEEGTKAEAVEFLQEQWNETCVMRAEIVRLTAQNTEVAIFLDELAGRLDNLSDIFARALGNREPTLPTHADDCRAMAAKLREGK